MPLIIEKKEGILLVNMGIGYETRNQSTFWCIHQADKIYKWKDFSPLIIKTGDGDEYAEHYSYSNPQGNLDKLVPDFNFHAWPQCKLHDYDDTVKLISQNGLKPFQLHKVGWIGSCGIHIRQLLIAYGKHYPNIFDFFDMKWTRTQDNIKVVDSALSYDKYISIPEMVEKYSILIDIEGAGYSGRLKYLLWSRRPLLIIDRPYKEYFFRNLKEWVHYIPVKRDLTDLVEKTNWCLTHYGEAIKIAESGYNFAKKYLTRDACFSRWNEIINNHDNPQSLGAFLQCYKNPYATFKCLESFRHFYPESTLVLLSDNAYDYSEMAKYFNCIYIHSNESIRLECQTLDPDSQILHMKKLIKRITDAYKLCKEDYVIWLEDDIIINNKITDTFNYDMNGWCPNHINIIRMDDVARDYPFIDKFKTYVRNGQGGTVFNKANIIKYFENEDFLDKILKKYGAYGCPWNQDFLFSFIVVLNQGEIGSYAGHGDGYGNMISHELCVQHQYKVYYGVPLPDQIQHLVRM